MNNSLAHQPESLLCQKRPVIQRDQHVTVHIRRRLLGIYNSVTYNYVRKHSTLASTVHSKHSKKNNYRCFVDHAARHQKCRTYFSFQTKRFLFQNFVLGVYISTRGRQQHKPFREDMLQNKRFPQFHAFAKKCQNWEL